jgi:TetR/AcrR family transcriptional regulator
MRGAPPLRLPIGRSLRGAEQAAAVMTSSVAAGLLRPMDPLLLFQIWAVTQHYADYEHQISFFHGQTVVGETDRVRLITEVTAFVLQGAEVHPRTQ